MSTTNHAFENPDYNGVDWHFAWYDNFEKLDRYVEIRDDEANLDQYEPISDAKFFARDTGAIYIGRNDEWEQVSVGEDGGESFAFPEYGGFADAPDEQGTVVWITGETDRRGLYRHDGTEYRRIGESGGGGGGGGGGIGGYHTETAPGGTQSFSWDVGIELDAQAGEQIEWVSVDPATTEASSDRAISVEGTEITVTYEHTPEAGSVLSWYWVAHDPREIDEEFGASALSQLAVDTNKNWEGFSITNIGSLEAEQVSVSSSPNDPTDVVRLSEFADVDSDVTALLGDVSDLQSGKADDPHGNEAHSTDYAEAEHDHFGDDLNPGSVTAASASVSNEPTSPTDVARQAELSEFLPRTGGTMTGDIDANGHRVRDASEVTSEVVEATDELHIPVHDGVPDSGNFYFRTDVDF